MVHRLVIGLFGLVGMLGVFTAPLTGRLVDNLVPWVGAVVATIGLIVFGSLLPLTLRRFMWYYIVSDRCSLTLGESRAC